MDENQNLEKEGQEAAKQVMPAEKKPNRAPLVIFAILILVALVGYGVYAWQNNRVAQLEKQVADLKKTEPTTTQTAKAPEDPYKGWSSYTTKYEKLTFKYPADFTLKTDYTPGGNGGINPGSEVITLVSGSGLKLRIWNGADGIGGSCPDCTYPKIDTVKLFGATNFMNYVDSGDGLISQITIATQRESYISGLYYTKNIKLSGSNQPAGCLYNIGYYDNSGTTVPKKLSVYTADPNTATFKKVVESFSY